MRVLLSAYACRPNAGSEPGVGWNWATHLAGRGIDVHVLVAKRNQETIEAGLREKPVPNLKFTFVSVPYQWAKKNEALHYVMWQFSALMAARELSSKCEFQLAHHVTYASVHVPTQLWRLGIPVVFGPVGGGQVTPGSMLPYFGAAKSREQLRSLVTKSLKLSPIHGRWLRRISLILAANRDTAKLVRVLGCKNARLMCDTAIPTDYFAQTPRSFEKQDRALRVLWVGRMLTRKALPLALDALKEVQQNVTFTIAGDGLDPEIVHQMIRERNLQQRVFWKGSRLTFQELRAAYAEHDVMLFTSLRDSFGSQLLEAMAMGLPIITLDLHGAHEFVPDSASLKVSVGTPGETVRNLAGAIEEFASFPVAKRNQMSMHAWNFAKTLSWSARAGLAERLYDEVLSRPKASDSTSVSKVAAASFELSSSEHIHLAKKPGTTAATAQLRSNCEDPIQLQI
jgi:glycosyltransferase involved in cell wall biosynthesis